MRRGRDERGSALVEFSWVAIILMVPLVWVVLSVFEVQRGAFAVHAAARAAGRAFALAPDDATGTARARAAAAQTLQDQGSPGMEVEVRVSCTTPSNCHVGTSVITVRVHTGVQLPLLPKILEPEHRSFQLTATHTLPIGQYVEAGADDQDEDPEDKDKKEKDKKGGSR